MNIVYWTNYWLPIPNSVIPKSSSTGTGGHCSRIHDYYLRVVNSKGIPTQIAAHTLVSVYWHGAISGAYPRTVAGSMATRVFPSTVVDTLCVTAQERPLVPYRLISFPDRLAAYPRARAYLRTCYMAQFCLSIEGRPRQYNLYRCSVCGHALAIWWPRRGKQLEHRGLPMVFVCSLNQNSNTHKIHETKW